VLESTGRLDRGTRSQHDDARPTIGLFKAMEISTTHFRINIKGTARWRSWLPARLLSNHAEVAHLSKPITRHNRAVQAAAVVACDTNDGQATAALQSLAAGGAWFGPMAR